MNIKPVQSSSDSNLTTSIVIYHFNCFLQSQNNGKWFYFILLYGISWKSSLLEYFVSRLDTINIDKNGGVSNFKFDEFKLFTLKDTGDYYTCIRTEDILNYKVFVKNAHLEASKKDKSVEYNISLWENNIVFWSTNFHLKALLLFR